MVLGIGKDEVKLLEDRFDEFVALYPGLKKVGTKEMSSVEPKIMEGRANGEEVLALYNEDGITINYGKLAENLITDGQTEFASNQDRLGEVLFSTGISNITKTDSGYRLTIGGKEVTTRFLSICAGAHSMYFAKQLGIEGIESQSLLLVAGNFYYTPKYLNAKVYTLQNPKLPFSAVHGDPDILNQDTKTRYGPTTRIVAQLERGKWSTTLEYLRTVSPLFASVGAYIRIMLDREFFFYALKHNVLFLVPGLGNYLFAKEVRKIIPTITFSDIERAKGQGGVRPQIVQAAKKNPLSLGEAKIGGEHISFNVTPSPGASTCVFNGLTDIKHVTEDLGATFYEYKMETDFGRSLELIT